MKKVILLFVALLSLSAMAQTKTADAPKTKYVAVGYSIGRQIDGATFAESTYPNVEVGYCPNSTSYGFIVGRGSFSNIFKGDNVSNYYWEAKISPSYTLGRVTGSVFVGTGAYFDTDHYFGEIGAGVAYKINNYSYGVSYGHWDTAWYVTPCISYSF